MKVDLVQCTVRISHEGRFGNLEVVKAGVDALPATEIPLLRAKNDLEGSYGAESCSIMNAKVIGQISFEKKADEMQRLSAKYGAARVNDMYPQGRNMPMTLDDCELPEECLAPVEKAEEPKKSAAARKDEMKAALEEAGVDVPSGNLSMADYEALLQHHELAV